MSAVPDPPVSDGALPALPPRRRRPARLRLVLLVAGVVVVVLAAFVVASRGNRGELRVIDVGFSEVREVDGLVVGSDPIRGRPPAISWAAVIENTSDDRVARDTVVRVEFVDDDGEVVDYTTPIVDEVPAGRRTAVTGMLDERVSAVDDIRVEIERTESWEPAGDAGPIDVDDLDVAYTSANQPIVRFTATSSESVRDRFVHVVFRDRDGRIIAGRSSRRLGGADAPLEPGEPVPDAAWSSFTLPDLATAEVYVEPTEPP
jgi:hypothetical protein